MSAVLARPADANALAAAEINREHALAQRAAESAIAHALRCGELLASVKRGLRHGEFMSWVAANCKFSHRTATLYMRAAKRIGNGCQISSLRGVYASDVAVDVAVQPPTAFNLLPRRLECEFCCPKCKYSWSGPPKPDAVAVAIELLAA